MVLRVQQNPVETPQLQVLGKVVDMPIVVPRKVPTVLTFQKTVEISLLQFTGKVVAILVVTQVASAEVEIPRNLQRPFFVRAACQWIGFPLVCH